MKRIRSLVFVLILAAITGLDASGCGRGAAGASIDEAMIDGAQARSLVASGATLLDVRTPGEWAGGHLEGAVLIPIQEIEARVAEIPRDRPVVVYCASGVRSSQATALLRRSGYDARDLGGMSRWDR